MLDHASKTMQQRSTIRNVVAVAAFTLVAAVLAWPAHGQATLDLVSRTQISQNNQRASISVFPGKAGYESSAQVPVSVSGPFGDGTVTDYHFVRSDGDVLISYASGAAALIYEVLWLKDAPEDEDQAMP